MRFPIAIATLCAALVGAAEAAEKPARPMHYTMFTLGGEFVQYGENTTGIAAAGPMMHNVFQRSSGFTMLTDAFGYYITTASTLLATRENEEWTLAPHGVVQTNRRIVRLADLEVLGAWRLVAPLWLVAGAHAETMSFTRSGYRYPQGTRGVLQGNPPRFAPDPFGNLQQVTTNGVTHYIVRQQGAINEDSLSVLAKLGVRYDTFFTDPRSDWRIVFGAFAAVPIYYRVTNTAFPDSVWTRFGPRGFDLSGELVVGRRAFGDLSLLVRVEGGYRFRPQTKTDPTTGGFVPDVKVRYLRAAVGGSWVF